jgi:hypothetical protein
MRTLISRAKAVALAAIFAAGVGGMGSASLAQELKQIELTEEKVTSFVAAQKDFAPLASKLAEGGEAPDPALTKELDEIAKKHGFANFSDFEDVGANITIVLDGLDRSSGTFTDPIEKMKKELEDIKADATIPAEDKKLAIDDLTQEIAAAQPLKFKGNIDVVKKHIDEIEALIPEEAGESGPEDGAAEGEAPAP